MQFVPALDGEGLDLLELTQHQRMVVGIAEQPHGEDGVDHGREDSAEPSGDGQSLFQPLTGGAYRALAQGAR